GMPVATCAIIASGAIRSMNSVCLLIGTTVKHKHVSHRPALLEISASMDSCLDAKSLRVRIEKRSLGALRPVAAVLRVVDAKVAKGHRVSPFGTSCNASTFTNNSGRGSLGSHVRPLPVP